jgi:hypothetical protein
MVQPSKFLANVREVQKKGHDRSHSIAVVHISRPQLAEGEELGHVDRGNLSVEEQHAYADLEDAAEFSDLMSVYMAVQFEGSAAELVAEAAVMELENKQKQREWVQYADAEDIAWEGVETGKGADAQLLEP